VEYLDLSIATWPILLKLLWSGNKNPTPPLEIIVP